MSFFTPSPTPERARRLVWILPRIALVLFVASVGGLLWYSHVDEREEQRATLVSDALWIEQNLRFQLDQTQERLKTLARAAESGSLTERDLTNQFTALQQASPGVIALRVESPTTPALAAHWPGNGPAAGSLAHSRRLAELTGRPAYSEPLSLNRDTVVAQIIAEGNGTAIALISLTRLIQQQVPWWFAAKYQLVLQDRSERVIAAKSQLNIRPGAGAMAWQMAFDPPGRGLTLKVTAYRDNSGLARNLLIGAVAMMAAALLFSWWRLKRHVQGRENAERALEEAYAFRQAMEESLPVGMRARDLQGRIIYTNPAFCRMTGFSAEALIGAMPPYPYWDPDTLEEHQRRNQEVLEGRAPASGFDARILHRDGHVVHTKVYTAPLIDRLGRHRGWMSSVIDVTEQKQAEAFRREQETRLQQTARLVSMGEMASTLAHELNQPLMAMSSYTGAARRLLEAGDSGELAATLEKIGQQAHRAAEVVRRIREFVRRRAPLLESVSIDSVIEDAVGLIAPELRARGVRLALSLAGDLPSIQGDRILLEQVMLNLIRNALDAVEGQSAERRHIEVTSRLNGDSIIVSVADRGHGIDQTGAERLFDAFYTTKPLGMGMGLSICRSVVENHHGKLSVAAHPEGGAVFTVSLPS
ncbi:sensor histidine kinase [Paludibacterium paludis]|uniref:histidine kinase n=1 Tax=Paludibacterium paludis TaxID=1225769 RepID=A0A918P1B7_9NEIS|nr:PAS domain-containing sensor histidine kinase [Paludibacterium paludis]GGY12735.1 PAS domain-containing sensor histidine kinase [Paludibacterium paludis]